MSPVIQAAIAELEEKRREIESAIETLRSIGGTRAAPPTLPEEKPAAKVRRKARTPKAAEALGSTTQSPLRAAILHVLRHKPLTSIQTFESVTANGIPKTTSGSVYQTLRDLAEKGVVERVQADDGTTAWRLLPV